MKGYGSDTYGESFADVYDDWYAEVSDVDATVASLSALAAGGPILELGVGTGRLAIPLARAGAGVVGIDSSQSMLDRLRAKPGAELVESVLGDMADLPFADHRFAVAFAAFNTFFNLPTRAQHERCARRLAEVIEPGGRLVIEGFLPPAEGMSSGGTSVREITLETAVVTVSKHDPDEQLIEGQHIEISGSGIRMRPWMIRYLTPPQLDELLEPAGFVLESRRSGWRDEQYDPDGEVHVSTYRLRSSPDPDVSP